MARKLGLGLVVVAVLAAVVWLLGGTLGLLGTDPGSDIGGPGEGAPREASGPEAPGAAGAEGERPVVLAARRPERRGIGSLVARVVDVKEAPLAGAAVRVTGTGHGDEVVALDATSDGEGAVVFAAVPAGDGYVVRVEAKGQPPVTVPDVEVRAGRRKDLGAILVGARAALAGRVVDEKGAAVAGADVRAFRGHENLLELFGNMVEMFITLGREPTSLAKATSDADGRFTLPDLPPGPVIVRATTAKKRAGFADARMTADGPEQGPVTIRLEPGALVAGVVVDAAGSPVPGATLAILSQGGDAEDAPEERNPFDFFSRRLFAVTDAKGAFSTRVPEGAKELRAVVEASGFPTTASREFAAGDTAVRIVLARGSVLEVTALDAATGRPVPGAQAVAMISEGGSLDSKESGGGILYGVTDDRGVVALPTGPGRVEMLVVQHPSYAGSMTSPIQAAMGTRTGGEDAEVPHEVKAGETARATVRLRAGVRLVGRVTDGAGAPLAGVEVKSVSFMGAGGSAAGRTDAEGNYVVEGLTGMMGEAPAMVSFRAPGWVPTTETVQLDPDVVSAGEARRDVKMRRAATLRGRVLDEAGKPVAGARVRHTGAAGGFDLEMMMGTAGSLTDAEGAYVLTEVPPAEGSAEAAAPAPDGEEAGGEALRRIAGMLEMRVAATADGFVPGRSAALKVREGEDVEVPAIRLSRGAVARGVVRLPGGRPAGGARVETRLDPEAGAADIADMMRTAMSTGRLARTVRADAEGRFEVAGLAPGTLTVVARADGYAPSRRKAKVGTEPVEVEVFLRSASDLSGRVHGADGRPLARATVAVEGTLAGIEGDEGYVESARAATDAEGRFTLKALPAGSVTVVVRADGHQRATMSAVPGGAPLEVRLEARAGKRSREQIQADIQKLSLEMAGAKDDDARQAAQLRLMELMEELRDDGDGDVPSRVTSVPEEDASPR
jgi:protocatechuate 3,4-dioxygenase beta subunit